MFHQARRPPYLIPSVLPQLLEEFPNIPSSYISKIMKENAEMKNIKNILRNEMREINDISSPNWVENYFKAFPCEQGPNCGDPYCVYYHSLSDKRRIYKYQEYSPSLCPKGGSCYEPEDCKFSHNLNEIFYHPEMYQKADCPYSSVSEGCPNEVICPFKHNRSIEESLVNSFKEVLNELDNIERESFAVMMDIKVKMDELGVLNEKNLCVCKKEISFIRVPCGHSCCTSCVGFDVCSVCKSIGKCIRINKE